MKYDQNLASVKLWQIAAVLFVVMVVAVSISPFVQRKYKKISDKVTKKDTPAVQNRLQRVG